MKSEEIYFSVIIPVYNLEKIITNTINSVLAQENVKFEIIVVNDGSTDNSVVEIEELRDKHSNIFVYSQKNSGVSSARNLGISKSNGKYLYFLDGDDTIEPDLLYSSYKKIEKYNLDIFSFGFDYIDSTGDVIKEYSNKNMNNKIFDGKTYIKSYLKKEVHTSICSLIIKRDLITIENLKFDINTKSAEDIEFIIYAISNSKRIYYTSNIYFHYFKREGSATNQPLIKNNFDVYKRMDNFLVEFARNEVIQYRSYWFVNFYVSIFKSGSDKETVSQFLEFDPVLEYHKFSMKKLDIVTTLFKLIYKPILKKILINKYNLNEIGENI